MAITRDINGILRLEEIPEQPHVALLHQKVCDSHNAGKRALIAAHLHSELHPIFPEVTAQEILRVLRELEQEGILKADEGGDQEFFLHTSTPGFRLEYASTAYRQAISDIYNKSQGSLYELLDHADSVMRFVKAARADSEQASKLFERFLSKRRVSRE